MGASFAELSVTADPQAAPAVMAPAADTAPAANIDAEAAFSELAEFFKDPNTPISLELIPPELRTPLQQLTPLTKCGKPTQARVRQEPFNADKSLPRELLTAIIGKPEQYADLETPVKAHSFACIDSRQQDSVLGTPGGDFGEFLVGLSVAEDLLNRPFADEEVFQLLRQFVTWNKRDNATFFLHTDDGAVALLASHLHVNGLTKVVTDIDMQDPPLALRDEMLELLADPAHQGSRVIKAFLQFPDKFRLRAGLTPALLRAAHRLLWNRLDTAPDGSLIYDRINLEVYNGLPEPRAWISVRSSTGCEVAGAAHEFSPINVVNRAVVPVTEADKLRAAAAAAKAKATRPVSGAEAAKAAASKSFIEAVSMDTVTMAALGVDADATSLAEVFSTDAPKPTPATVVALSPPAAAAAAAAKKAADAKKAAEDKQTGRNQKVDKKKRGVQRAFDERRRSRFWRRRPDGDHHDDHFDGHFDGPHGDFDGRHQDRYFDGHHGDDAHEHPEEQRQEAPMSPVERLAAATKQAAAAGEQIKSDPNLVPTQVFVHHPDAVRDLRKWISRFLVLRFPHAASQPEFLQAFERKQQSVLEGVAESLGRNVPFYTVTIE
jgi:hypothetical protein